MFFTCSYLYDNLIISLIQKRQVHDMTSVARTKSGHLEKKYNFRKLPVTVNLQALREKLETSNGKLLEAERRKIVNLEVNLQLDEVEFVLL